MNGDNFGSFPALQNNTFVPPLRTPDPYYNEVTIHSYSSHLMFDLSNVLPSGKGQTGQHCSLGKPLTCALAADRLRNYDIVSEHLHSGGLVGTSQRQLCILNNTCLVLMEVSSGTRLISQRLQSGLDCRDNCCKHNGP